MIDANPALTHGATNMPSLRDCLAGSTDLRNFFDYFQEMLAFGFLASYISDCFDGHLYQFSIKN